MPTPQEVGTITYDRPRSAAATESTTLASEFRLVQPLDSNSNPVDNAVEVEWWQELDPAAVAEVSTVTITAGTDGDYYTVSVDDGTTSEAYTYQQVTGDDADAIASKLAKRLDLHPGIRAEIDGTTANQINVTGVVAGTALAIDESASTTALNVTVAETTAASGTAKHGHLGTFRLTFGSRTVGGTVPKTYPQVSVTGDWYDADTVSPPATVTTTISARLLEGDKTFDEIQTANGVDRPV